MKRKVSDDPEKTPWMERFLGMVKTPRKAPRVLPVFSCLLFIGSMSIFEIGREQKLPNPRIVIFFFWEYRTIQCALDIR